MSFENYSLALNQMCRYFEREKGSIAFPTCKCLITKNSEEIFQQSAWHCWIIKLRSDEAALLKSVNLGKWNISSTKTFDFVQCHQFLPKQN